MTHAAVLYGPDSLAFETYDAVTPVPGVYSDNTLAQRGRYPLGTQLVMQDGRKYRFTLAGGSDLVVGNVIQGAAVVSTDVDLTPTTPTSTLNAAGARYLSFTHGSGTAVVNYFAEGYAVISLAPGAGHCYPIASHLALTSGGTGEIVYFRAGHSVRETLTTTSDIDLVANPWASVIQAVITTITAPPVGVAVSVIPAGDFGWLQTAGMAGVLTIGTVVVGNSATAQTGTAAGACGPAGDAVVPVIGTVKRVAASTEWSSILLSID